VATGLAAGAAPGLDAPAATAGAAAEAARLQGTWSVHGRVTRADGVRGEHKGQRVRRSWTFQSTCAAGPCRTVSLSRERSLRQVDRLVLTRAAPRRYVGHGRFYVRLRCGGRTYPRGGVAYETVRVTISASATVQSTPFATAIRADYTNPRRVNRTPCAGNLGRDAGTYSGTLSTPLPAPPAPEFTSTTDPVTGTVTFADASKSSNGARVASWNWDFGDPASGSANSSSAANPSHHYGAPGSYTVTLTVTDRNGLTATITHQVVV
jgi:hypothetical protein